MTNIGGAWRRLLIDVEFAKHYPASYSLSMDGVAVRNPVLDQLLPSLLQIKAVTIPALKDALAQKSLKAPRHISWTELADDVEAIQQVLMDMGHAPKRPELRVVAERSALRDGTEPGVAFAVDDEVAIKDGDHVIEAIKWTERTWNAIRFMRHRRYTLNDRVKGQARVTPSNRSRAMAPAANRRAGTHSAPQ